MQLSDEEREHIRLSEEYRAEVRAKLAAPQKSESLFDKLAVPLVIVIVSGLLVPWILGRVEENRRALDLQSRLIEQIVGDDGEAQVNIWLYRRRVAEYELDHLQIELDKRLLALRSFDAEERQARRAELQQELTRVRAAHDEARAAVSAGAYKYAVEHSGNREWVILHYGHPAALKAYTKATEREHGEAARGADLYALAVTGICTVAGTKLRSCPEEPSCRAIFDEARVAVEKRRDEHPIFQDWDNARRELVHFISTTKPRI